MRCRISNCFASSLLLCVQCQAGSWESPFSQETSGRSQIWRGFGTQTPPYLGWEEPTWKTESGPGVALGPGVVLQNISSLCRGRGIRAAREEGVRPERQEKNQEGKAKNSTEMFWKRRSGLPWQQMLGGQGKQD